MDDLLNTKQDIEYGDMNPQNMREAKLHKDMQTCIEAFQNGSLKPVQATVATSSVVALSDLRVDPELEALIAPLTTAEFQQLTDSCSAEGIRDPILLWNGTIVDGHNRYRIAQTLGLDFVPVKSMSFSSRNAAKRWIIENQLGRRNVSKYERCRLALLLKDSVAAAANQRMLAGKADPPQISAEGTTGETRDTLAKLAGVSHDTLSKVEILEREADDELKAKLRADSISINKAWKNLQSQQPKTNKNATALLDTTSQSAEPSSAPNPVDNGTTSPVAEVVMPEPQASVSSPPSDDDVSDNETSPESVIKFITISLGGSSQDCVQFISSNDFYFNEEVLEKEWAHSFTAVVSEDVSKPFWEHFKKAIEKNTLTKVLVLTQVWNDIDISCFYRARWILTNYGYGVYPFRLMMFDFTEES